MGLFDVQKGTGMGFASLINEKGFTNEDLLEKLSEIEVSFGKPEMGAIMGTPAVMYKNVSEGYDVFVRIHKNKVIMGKMASSDSSTAGSLLDAALSIGVFDGAKSEGMSKADHAVDELCGIVEKLEKDQEVTESEVVSAVNTTSGEKLELYMKQKFLAIKPQFDICDKDEKPLYHVEGDLVRLNFSIQKNGEEVLKLKKKPIAILPEYTLVKNGSEIGTIKKKFKLTNPELVGTVNGKELKINGSLLGCNFDIRIGGAIIAQVDTVQTFWADCYRIAVFDESYADVMAALGVICDAVVDSEKSLDYDGD